MQRWPWACGATPFPNAFVLSLHSHLCSAFSVAVFFLNLFYLIAGLRAFDETRVHKILNLSLPIYAIVSGSALEAVDLFFFLLYSNERKILYEYVFSWDRSAPTSASLWINYRTRRIWNLKNVNFETAKNHSTVSDEWWWNPAFRSSTAIASLKFH